MNNKLLAMYDIRGIQDYIFRTTKLRDAIGASAIVEDILSNALEVAVKSAREQGKQFSCELEWEDEANGRSKEFRAEDEKDVQVLYIGGGNAFVTYRDIDLCRAINRLMSKYVIEATYSLQLAIAVTEITGDYSEDNKKVNMKMSRAKADMSESSPVGALPVMDIELASGLPLSADSSDRITNEQLSKETAMKRDAEWDRRKRIKLKKLDNLIEEKGTDSTLAVVHIDGNNMGLRIRALMDGEREYVSAVNKIRRISYSINHSFKDVFEDMVRYFNASQDREIRMLKVIAAGDDITYICTAKAAIASVEYFVNNITKRSITGNPDDLDQYGFSICAGIAYIRSHFPFSIGYQVAEACCESAKSRAKNAKTGNKVGNFFDYQFCKNVQTQNIKAIRKNEYKSPSGEYLMLRPYEIGGDTSKPYNFENLRMSLAEFVKLKDDSSKKGDADYKTLPRKHAKAIRNTYSLGRAQMSVLKSFLESRGWKLPGQKGSEIEFYFFDLNLDGEERGYTAKYYDALELMDDYIDLKDFEKKDDNNAEEEIKRDETV